jgi:hypothetical protein
MQYFPFLSIYIIVWNRKNCIALSSFPYAETLVSVKKIFRINKQTHSHSKEKI